MKKHMLAGIALTALVAGRAMAADLPVRAPVYRAPPPAVVFYNWTGCYIGANVGGGWTSNSNTHGDPLPDPVTYAFVPMDVGTNGSGVVAGGQVGCNLQASSFVFGVEGDLSWSGVKGEGTVGPIESIPPGAGFVAGSFATSTHKVTWLSTIRGRFGAAFDRLLVYATGGVAFAGINTTADEVFLTPVSNPGSLDSTRIGWVAGAGLEYAVTYNWIVRGEYLYHQFASDTFVGLRVPALPTFGVQYTTSKTSLSVARVALSYKFGDPPPVINYSK